MAKNGNKQQWLSFAIAFLLSLIAIVSQPMGKIDRVWSDVMLTSAKTPVSQDYLIVDITAEDAAPYGGLPLPRNVLAETLRRLNDAGADRVLLDMSLSENLSTDKDFSLIAAASRLGPDRLAIATKSDSKFSTYTTSVDFSLRTDRDGWTRHVRTSGNNPARWLAAGQLSGKAVDIDLRYDPASVSRVSLGSVIGAENLDVSNHLVIVSPNSGVAQSRLQIPLSDKSDRAVILALGSQSIASGYEADVKKSWILSVFFALVFLVVGVVFATIVQKPRVLFAAGLMTCLAVVGLNMGLMKLWGAPAYPVLQFSCFLIGLIITLSFRLRIFQMITGFLRGDLSPEEAWAWRAHEESESPVILINAMGAIRRMNTAAQIMKPWLGDDFGERCLAEFLRQSENISVRDESGELRTFSLERPNIDVPVIILKDITEIARHYDTLKADRNHLQQTVCHLQQSQSQALERAETLEQKRIRAEQTSQLKSDFLANMSHELRTPLNAINGFSDILHREIFGPLGDPRYKGFAKDILFSGQHLLSLINDILDLSKIEAGKMTLRTETLQVEELISQVMRMLKMRAEEKQLMLTCDNTALPQITADGQALKQVLLNLLTNAIKFTPEGGAVRISTQVISTGLAISISDSGIGISQSDIERLGQPFEQVISQDSKTQEGTGLGLALSKSFIELHGGIFDIKSIVGKGTTVTITLPLDPQIAQAKPAAAHKLMPPPVPASVPVKAPENSFAI